MHPSGSSDLTGKSFGRLRVVRFKGRDRYGSLLWRCACKCGVKKVVSSSNLQRTKSCGCLRREVTRDRSSKPNRRNCHGKRTAEYRTWTDMWSRVRASRKRCSNYRLYVLRGIKVCRRWKSFDNFLKDMGPRPAGHSIDRKNNDGNYTPKNCRWATRSQQAQNRRDTVRLRWKGKTWTLRELAAKVGVRWDTIYARLLKGWPLKDALLPVGVRTRWTRAS